MTIYLFYLYKRNIQTAMFVIAKEALQQKSVKAKSPLKRSSQHLFCLLNQYRYKTGIPWWLIGASWKLPCPREEHTAVKYLQRHKSETNIASATTQTYYIHTKIKWICRLISWLRIPWNLPAILLPIYQFETGLLFNDFGTSCRYKALIFILHRVYSGMKSNEFVDQYN